MVAKKTATAKEVELVADAATGSSEAKSRFNAAMNEAKAGANALSGEAKARGQDFAVEAKEKAGELAIEGKVKASEALASLAKLVDENAAAIDEKFGAKYGDYARTASRSLQESAKTLSEKSYEELGEDAREIVRNNPGKSVGIAAVAGFLLARIFRR